MQPDLRDAALYGGADSAGRKANAPVRTADSMRRPDASTTKSDIVPSIPQRIAQTEAELERLRLQLQELRHDWERESANELRGQLEAMREAVLRYSFACAEVDMRLALIRARADDTVEAAEILRRSLEEQTAASDELRRLARTLHQPSTATALGK